MTEATETVKMPRIVYVDENEDARSNFFTDAYQSGLFAKIYILAPEPTLPQMVEKLFELQVDAVISDFQLTDAGPVDYTGEILVEAILSKRADFPCFIQTSFDDAALKAADDVNRVYSKVDDRTQFLKRVVIQIEHHHARLAEWQAELDELLALDRKALSAVQVERIIDLDEAIEKNLGLDDRIARQVKRDVVREQDLYGLHRELMERTEALVAKMRSALDD
jgi:hypothetical protein